LDKKAVPEVVRPLNGMSACTATVLPGIVLSSGPDCIDNNHCNISNLALKLL